MNERIIVDSLGTEKTIKRKETVLFPDKKDAIVDEESVLRHLSEARKIYKEGKVGQREAVVEISPSYPDLPSYIWLLNDLHAGSVHTDYERFLKDYDIVLNTPNFFVITNGDLPDNFLVDAHPVGLYENPISPEQQALLVRGLMKKLEEQKKLLCLSFGNHEDFIRRGGLSFEGTWLRDFSCPVLDCGGLLTLKVGEQEYKMAITHRFWGICLGGSTLIPIFTPNGFTVMYLKDILKTYGKEDGTIKEGVYLVNKNGQRAKLLRWAKRKQPARHIKFRDGLEITCSDKHKFLLADKGLIKTQDIKVGDVVQKLKGFDFPRLVESKFDYNWGWFIGLYLAEGSLLRNGIQLSIHQKEAKRFLPLINKLFADFGIKFKKQKIKRSKGVALFSTRKIPVAIIKTFIKGKTSFTKRLTPEAFKHGKEFLRGIVDGWLDGDGHYEKYNQRWDAKICRNRKLARNLRTICWIVGYSFRLTKGHNTGYITKEKKEQKFYRIKIRKIERGHWLKKEDTEVQRIRKCFPRQRELFDIEVEGGLFALTNGAITHNSKLNPTNSCKRFIEHRYPDADISYIGHSHQAESLYFERGGKKRLAIIGGCYKVDDEYPFKKGIGSGGQMGGLVLQLRPDKKDMEIIRSCEDAQKMFALYKELSEIKSK